jgi:hypothetical protein
MPGVRLGAVHEHLPEEDAVAEHVCLDRVAARGERLGRQSADRQLLLEVFEPVRGVLARQAEVADLGVALVDQTVARGDVAMNAVLAV